MANMNSAQVNHTTASVQPTALSPRTELQEKIRSRLKGEPATSAEKRMSSEAMR